MQHKIQIEIANGEFFKEIKTNKKLDTMPNLTLHSHTPNEPAKWIFELR
jgi:hypothetical protein